MYPILFLITSLIIAIGAFYLGYQKARKNESRKYLNDMNEVRQKILVLKMKMEDYFLSLENNEQ